MRTLMTDILEKIDGRINDLVSYLNEKRIENGDKPMTDLDRKYFVLDLTFNLCKSIESFTLNTDELVSINSSYSPKGLEISAKINRDNVEYYLYTECIYAGGYNIQKLHYRYITKTNLPKTNNIETISIIKQEIKKIKKQQKIQSEINLYEKWKIEVNDMLQNNLKLTDSEIYQQFCYKWKDYDELSDTAPIKLEKTKDEYIRFVENEKTEDIKKRKN